MIKEIEVDGVRHSIQAENTIKVTWAELKALRDEARLNPGSFYRITDYVTTTTQVDTKSAGHPFDVIVLALSENTLCEDAKAILHEGDEYFAHCDLSAWQLMYCLDNDKSRFEWADETNGKGVIYRMIDEKQNDCPYDFKNILIQNTEYGDAYVTKDKYYYTFSYVVNGVLYDGTVEVKAQNCYSNSMKENVPNNRYYINRNVFKNSNFNDLCYSNIFGTNCKYNSFNDNCYSNTFGNGCYSNTFDGACYRITFGNNCAYNKFGHACQYNVLGNNNFRIYFDGSCKYNILGNNCNEITLNITCEYNTFGNNCKQIKFEYGCRHNKLGDGVLYYILAGYSKNIIISHSEEFYDDGSGQVVPIKHPDLSTQPSILPYKFMGQYVYEQLIQYTGKNIPFSVFGIDKPLILRAEAFGMDGYSPCYIQVGADGIYATAINSTASNLQYMYYKITYTSMPEDETYYEYENGGVIPDTGMIIQLPFYVDNLETYSGEKAQYLGNNLYHLPLTYIQSYHGTIMLKHISGITRGDGNYTDVKVTMHSDGIAISYPNQDFIQVNLYSE